MPEVVRVSCSAALACLEHLANGVERLRRIQVVLEVREAAADVLRQDVQQLADTAIRAPYVELLVEEQHAHVDRVQQVLEVVGDLDEIRDLVLDDPC